MGFAEIAKAWKPETVHGLREISTPLTLKSVLTIMWVCACSVLCLWEVYNTVVTFIRFDVKTTSEVLEAKTDGIPFPGITVCSASIGRKSFLGGSPEKTISLMSLMTRTTDVSKLNPMVETCRGASPPIGKLGIRVSTKMRFNQITGFKI